MRYRLSLFSGVLLMIGLFMTPAVASAAACYDGNNYGVASVNIGTLPHSGSYNIWTRMQATNAKYNRYQLEINGDTCFVIGGSSVRSDGWQWISSEGNDSPTTLTHNFTETTGNSLRLIGSQPGVKVDSVLLVPDECVPVEQGDNCRSATSARPIKDGPVSSLNSGLPQTGSVILSDSLSGDTSEVLKVEYSSSGKKLQASDGATGFDTTLLPNGSHAVTTKIIFKDGTSSSQTSTITVNNDSGLFTPVYRWARTNKGLLKMTTVVLGVISVLGLSYTLVRVVKTRNHYLRTHGF